MGLLMCVQNVYVITLYYEHNYIYSIYTLMEHFISKIVKKVFMLQKSDFIFSGRYLFSHLQ